MQDLTLEIMQQARLERDTSFDGKFFVGIKTTKIYCIPSCKARQSKEGNIEFFMKRIEAEQLGYRGCKRCHSETFPNVKPKWIDGIKKKIENEFQNDFTEIDLAELVQVDLSTLRRKFKTYYNKTPTEYQRALKLEKAKELLEQGENVYEILSQSGFKSVSGFRSAFIKKFGYSPKVRGDFINGQ